VTPGYYQQPEENAKAFTPDGFLRTGDVGVMDATRLHAHRRPQEGHDPGERLQRLPNELENVISLCPGVVECAAIGVPDEKQGEAIKVFVVKNDPTLTEDTWPSTAGRT
jgi:long-chain acyl-CoA synthetase